MAEKKIWVLVDNRVGNSNQAVILAKKTGIDFEIKNIEYNFFAKLPSEILSYYPLHVRRATLKSLKAQDLPEIIISSGRRTAALAVYLKRISGDKIKIVQIMRPNLPPKEFKLIILPQHDSCQYNMLPNTIRMLGSLTDINENLSKLRQDFYEKHPDFNEFIAVIIGGSTKNYNFTLENAKQIADIIDRITKNHSLPALITFSRRTPKNVKQLLRERFKLPHICYDPDYKENYDVSNVNKCTDNPYPGMLAAAKFIITTPDSISMCSEAASTGKPNYVYIPDNFTIKKHRFFIQQLMDIGAIRKLTDDMTYLEEYKYQPLAEINKIAEIIHRDI